MQSEFRTSEFEARRAGRFGSPLRAVAVTGSTNVDALAWAEHGAPEGAVMLADAQTAGRGRRGRTWLDRPGESLLFSLVLRPRFSPGLITTALGVAVCEGIERVSNADCRIKWPNDVTIARKKVAGILVESRVAGGAATAVVAGVGVNVTWADLPEEIAALATSLLLSTGGAPAREDLLSALLSSFEARYDALAAGDRAVVAEAAARSETLGTNVRVVWPGGAAVSGRAVRLEEDGTLVVDTPEGEVVVDSGALESLRAE